jgi:hypothetical protein
LDNIAECSEGGTQEEGVKRKALEEGEEGGGEEGEERWAWREFSTAHQRGIVREKESGIDFFFDDFVESTRTTPPVIDARLNSGRFKRCVEKSWILT